MAATVVRKGDTQYLLMGLRQVLIMLLGLLEDYLGHERSIVPRHRRIDT